MWFQNQQDQSQPEHQQEKKKILLVEDELFLADLFRVALKSDFLEVDVIHDGLEVIPATEQKMYDLIFLDLTLPEKDGYQLLTELRHTSRYQFSPIVILTNHSELETMKKVKELGATDFLIKAGMDYTKLQDVVKRFLSGQQDVSLQDAQRV